MTAVDRRTTIYDVAARAKVSVATVSHVLNRPEKVHPSTRARVQQVINDLDFVPKESAVSRARRGVGRIGVLAPFSRYPSYLERLSGLLGERTGRTEVVVFDHDVEESDTRPMLAALPSSGSLDGLVVMGIPLDEPLANRLLRRGPATILVDGEYEGFSSVSVRDDLGGLMAGRHLIERGHRQVVLLSESGHEADPMAPDQRRWFGAESAFRSAGLPPDSIRRVRCGRDFETCRGAVEQIMAMTPRPTAVFAHHDELAAAIVTEARCRGLRVPEDLAVIGYDGGVLAEALQLTTIEQPLRETGATGRRLLMATLGGATEHQVISLKPHLVEGATT